MEHIFHAVDGSDILESHNDTPVPHNKTSLKPFDYKIKLLMMGTAKLKTSSLRKSLFDGCEKKLYQAHLQINKVKLHGMML